LTLPHLKAVGFLLQRPLPPSAVLRELRRRLDSQLCIDEYPAYWTVPIEDALCALEYAFVHRARGPWLSWNDETVLDSRQAWQTINGC
jgi:hypothetical protein